MQVSRGMSLIDVLIGTALMLIIFLGLTALLQASLRVSMLVKSEATAVAVANSQMETIRSLPYASVGTIGGIPAGTIAQNATTTEDGTPYGVRTFIDYYDDPADGTGSSDSNGITTDYKRIKVAVTYVAGNKSREIDLVSLYAPPALETTVNGGTLQINVVNAQGTPLAGASVTIVNSSTTPTVNLTTFSDATGEVYLPGALPSTQYAVTVTKNGYSTAQTYIRDSNNQNPSPGYLTVVKNQTTSSTFAIDQLSTLTINTFSPIATSTFQDAFSNGSKIATLSNAVAGGGTLTLSGGAGNYALSGSAISNTTAPAYLSSWSYASTTMTTPTGTSAAVHVVDASGTLLPDSVLPGNAAGFTAYPINLWNISTSTYPALALKANLQTTSTSSTPTLTGWSLNYQAGPIPLPNIPFTLTGAKQIGSTGGGAPIYKTTVSTSTNSSGTNALTLEWDSYALSLPSLDIVDACGSPPFALAPGTSVNESLILSTPTTNSILVSVGDSSGNIISGASVTLSKSGFTKTVTSTACGNAYFGAVSAGTYSITISKSGYTSNTTNNVAVSGDTFYAVSF